jgi:class 3 adenylate cyclase
LTPEPVTRRARHLTSPDGAVTLLVSDIADADSVSERLGAERWEQLIRDHHALVEETVVGYDGQVLRFERDGFLASFNSAHAGLHAAAELRRAFTEIAAGVADDDLSLRIGAHSGFVLATPEQPQGRNVVLAARIADLAKAGEILVSSTLKQYTEHSRSVHFEPRGEYHFKGLHGEHVVYAAEWL